MPKVHKRTFVFLITFMKYLLKYSEANGLDPKVLGMSSCIVSTTRLFFECTVVLQGLPQNKIQSGCLMIFMGI